MYRLGCSHPRIWRHQLVHGQSSSHQPTPTSLILERSNFTYIFKLRERRSPLLERQITTAGTRRRDIEACVLSPSIPTGRCVGALCITPWACRIYRLLACCSLELPHREFPERKKCAFKRGCCTRCGEFFFFLCWTSKTVGTCLFMSHVVSL